MAAARIARITLDYEDGTISRFDRLDDGSWVLNISGAPLTVTGYDPPNVMRVLANGLGTTEIAD